MGDPAGSTRTRFAPSTTGPAHPGTLLAALLSWLDARSQGAHLQLRLEDIDPERSRPNWVEQMIADLAWMGLEFDSVLLQSEQLGFHEAALDQLDSAGRLYPCGCTRTDLRAAGQTTPDGGWRYPGTCRDRRLPTGGWRASTDVIRLREEEGVRRIRDEGGLDLSQDVAASFGDPVLRRRDGSIAYHLASVVDDAHARVTRIVRGRDLAASTATQVSIQAALGHPTPVYRHHLLLLEEQNRKLAKLHGSVSLEALRPTMAAPALTGFLAMSAGLRAAEEPVEARELLEEFDWSKVRSKDRLVRWDGSRLTLDDAARSG